VTEAAHGTSAGWHTGCRCTLCRQAHNDTQRAFGRARAQKRLPVELRQQLLDGIYAGQSFRSVVRDLNLTPNQIWGLTKSDEGWSTALEAALTASRRVDLQHGTMPRMWRGVFAANAAVIKGQDGEAAQLGQLVWFIPDVSAERPQHQQPGPRDCEETAHG
jgi:hypothetical protein